MQVALSDVLRQVIQASEIPYLRFERETGVKRHCVSRFVRGSNGLHIRQVDRLAEFLGLELRPVRKSRRRK